MIMYLEFIMCIDVKCMKITCVCVCVCIHTEWERDRQRVRGTERQRERELHDLFAYFGKQSLVGCFICKYFLWLWGRSFILFIASFLCCAKAFNYVLFVYFCFYFHYSRRWMKKHIAVIYIKECSACVFL